MDKKTVIVFDTNVLIDDPKAVTRYPNDLIIIPSMVMEELDGLKNSTKSDTRSSARAASNLIDSISEAYEDSEDLFMTLENGGHLYIDEDYTVDFKTHDPSKPDNIIIATALRYAKQSNYESVIFYSNDTNVRNVARAQARAQKIKSKIKARKYSIIDKSLLEISSGVSDVILRETEIAQFRIDGYLKHDLPYINGEHIMLRSEANPEKNTALGIWDKVQKRIIPIKDYKKKPIWQIGGSKEGATNVFARDSRQNFLANDILNTDKNLHFVLSRVAGAGKNFITTACALSLLNDGHYDRLIMIKPMISVEGADTGYLPGTKEEKMAPWFESFNDTMSELTNDGQMNLGEVEAKIELDIVTHMRGRSIPNVIMIIDEAQNFSDEAIKTLVTRAGENVKIILMGDLSQIDNHRLDSSNCGLRVWAERARNKETGYDKSTYILLDSNFRSELSAWASSFFE